MASLRMRVRSNPTEFKTNSVFFLFLCFFYIYKKVSKNQGPPVLHLPNPNHNKARKHKIKFYCQIIDCDICTISLFSISNSIPTIKQSSKKIKIKIQEININFPFIYNLESRVFFECQSRFTLWCFLSENYSSFFFVFGSWLTNL